MIELTLVDENVDFIFPEDFTLSIPTGASFDRTKHFVEGSWIIEGNYTFRVEQGKCYVSGPKPLSHVVPLADWTPDQKKEWGEFFYRACVALSEEARRRKDAAYPEGGLIVLSLD